MGEISISKAAFAGYRLIGKHPVSVLVWMVIGFGYLLGIGLAGAAMSGEALAAMADMRTSGAVDMTSMMQLQGQMAPYGLLSFVARALVTLLLTAAILRALLRPGKAGLAYIRLSGDELRLAATLVVIGVLSIIITLIAFVILTIFAVVGRMAGGPVAGIVGASAGGVVLAIALLVFQVRFGLAASQTMAERAIRIFESWTLTKGRFWPIAGAILISLVSLLPFVAILGGGAAMAAIKLDATEMGLPLMTYLTGPAYSVEEMLTPARLIACALMAILWILTSVVTMGTSSSLYLQLRGEQAADIFSDDDDDDDDDDD